MNTSTVLPDVGVELREGFAEVGDVSLHYVEAGDGPLIVLLHGFPEFWFGWRLQIEPLVAAGFRVVAPDTRGYNLSSKPEGFEAYAVDLLAADIRGGFLRDCTTRASSGSPGTSSSSRRRDCPRRWCTLGTGTSSDTSFRTRIRLTRRRSSTATSRRGRSRGQQPG